MNLKVGIVGLPNAGKSTLFNALLKKQQALAANYPFATIDPNVGVVPVPDERLAKLAQIVEKEEGIMPPVVPATVEFVDIAGLVKGASVGEGLGNKFLSYIREVNLICHVIRAFKDPDVIHVLGEMEVWRDKQIIETELILADLQTLEKQVEPRGVTDKKILDRWQVITKLKEKLNLGALAQECITDPLEKQIVSDLHLLTMKPVVYVLNVSETDYKEVPFQRKEELIDARESFKPDAEVVNISAKIESELSDLPEEEQKTYLKELGVSASGLERLIQNAYKKLGLISFLTAGSKEVKAWTIERGTKAPQAAGVIHTDFEKKFIKAEVVSYDDLIKLGSKQEAASHGKLRLEGREYEMRDGDVVEFKIGA